MKMSREDIQALLDNRYNESEKYRIERLTKIKELREKYVSVLDEAKLYVPPTKNHVNFKNFMISQLEDSIKGDCNEEYYETPTKKTSVEDFIKDELGSFTQDISYHEKEYNKEVERVKNNNEWISQLRKSLENL